MMTNTENIKSLRFEQITVKALQGTTWMQPKAFPLYLLSSAVQMEGTGEEFISLAVIKSEHLL